MTIGPVPTFIPYSMSLEESVASTDDSESSGSVTPSSVELGYTPSPPLEAYHIRSPVCRRMNPPIADLATKTPITHELTSPLGHIVAEFDRKHVFSLRHLQKTFDLIEKQYKALKKHKMPCQELKDQKRLLTKQVYIAKRKMLISQPTLPSAIASIDLERERLVKLNDRKNSIKVFEASDGHSHILSSRAIEGLDARIKQCFDKNKTSEPQKQK
jgi:hypothetical protein